MKLKGDRMKVGGTALPNLLAPGQAGAATRVDDTAPAAPVSGRAPAAESILQSSVLAPAMKALADMPEIDHAKVAALRDALARGEVPFNAARLAALIESHHGNRG